MKIEFSKDVLQDMMAQYGKEYAIENLYVGLLLKKN